MDYVADLHLHSKYARAVSKDMTLPIIAQYARQKGLHIVSAPDWTHGLWFKEIRTQLVEENEGLYKLKSEIRNSKSETNPNSQNSNIQREPLFLLATEIASIYSFNGKVRRVHNLVFAPNLETAEKINKELIRRGCNLISDGRPIIGISSKNLLELIMSISTKTMLIPCHVWTPHFGVYGSASGFDSLEEAFGELSQYIYGIETGLSSDPEMNWEMWELTHRSILSFSDAHSPAKMGREATVFTAQNSNLKAQSDSSKLKISYDDIAKAIKRDPNGMLKIGYTIEFYPEEGKYHFSGHRNCHVSRGPEEIKTEGNICSVCKKKLTEGVLFRVQQLASKKLLDNVEKKTSKSGIKWYTDKTKNHPPYVKLVPLLEIIAEALGSSTASQKAKAQFQDMCSTFGSEIDVLLKVPLDKIQHGFGARVAEGIKKVREGNIVIDPGFDGVYGKVRIWQEKVPISGASQNPPETQLGLKF